MENIMLLIHSEDRTDSYSKILADHPATTWCHSKNESAVFVVDGNWID